MFLPAHTGVFGGQDEKTPVDWVAQTRAGGTRRLLTGRPEDMAADVDALARAGIRHLCLTFQTASLAETLERMQRFAEDVMPLVG